MIYTTHFNALRHHTTVPFIPVSIARFKAKYVQVDRQYKILAPSKDLLLGYKNGQISDAEYTVQFLAQLEKLNANNIIEDLRKLGNGKSVGLICHCSTKNFCHRHLVAEWIKNCTGRNVVEFKNEKCLRIDGKLAL